MSTVIVEIGDFSVASWSMFRSAGDPLADRLFRTTVALAGCGASAGADPAGAAWAARYDDAAAAVLTGMRAAANGAYRLADLFGQSARNYAAADAASDSSGRDAIGPLDLPGVADVSWDVHVPSAAGGPAGGPPGWSLVSSVVGRVWPGGHQDRLRAAAGAWRAAADELSLVGRVIRGAPGVFAADRLPEFDDVTQVCRAASDGADQLALAAGHLAQACEAFAEHLDEVHSAVEHELISLAEWTAGIEGIGQLASALTLGAAEGPTQSIEAGRIALVAGRIAELIDAFAGLVARITESIPTLTDIAERAGRAFSDLFDAPVAVAEVTAVPRLSVEARTASGVTRAEMVAARDLGGAGKLPELRITRAQVEKKFRAHAAQFGVTAPRGRAGFVEFDAALRSYISSPNIERIRGTYRRIQAIINYDRDSGLMLLQHTDGSFWSCWELNEQQWANVLRNGSLGGG